ncbi:hypothetical protein GCM10022243_43950 [Saccharothrix violaceirubra]
MSVEVVISPRGELPAEGSAEEVDWESYGASVVRVFEAVARAAFVTSLEVTWLLLPGPLPERLGWLRLGAEVTVEQATELLVGMLIGKGPYCRLVGARQFTAAVDWDGIVLLLVPDDVAERAGDLGDDEACVEFCTPSLSTWEAPGDLVTAAADSGFWERVRVAGGELVLVREDWADGRYGTRWFRVTAENVDEVAGAVWRRSRVTVVVDPVLFPAAALDDYFTAFPDVLTPGELRHCTYQEGVEDVSEVTDEGLSLMLPEEAMGRWVVVVPDADGVVRGEWLGFMRD